MRVFLRFGDAHLGFSGQADDLAHGHDHVVLFEHHVHIFKPFVVARHGDEVQRQGFHTRFGHVLLGKHRRKFAQTVGAEVEAEHHVAFLNVAAGCGRGDRFGKFVGDAVFIRRAQVRRKIGSRRGRCPVHQQVVGAFDTFPAFVAVHGVIPADQ